jgi:hypothetical protein
MRNLSSRSSRTDESVERFTGLSGLSRHKTPGETASDARVATGDLFAALDGHIIGLFEHSWQIRVYSILEQRNSRWLQLSLEGDPDFTLTVRTSVTDDADQTVRVLSDWLAHPGDSDTVLSVA